MRRSRWFVVLAALFAFALVAAACGDDDDDTTAAESDEGSDDTTADDGSDEGSDDTTADEGDDEGSGDTASAGSIEELEAQWAENRDAIVARAAEEGWGINDDNVLVGPEGFEIDLNDCPADWDPTEGVTDSAIALGQAIAMSGNLAAYGDISVAQQIYFDYITENGGIGGRSLEVDAKDDAYDATRTIEAVDELITAEEVFRIQTLGSPNSLATYDRLNEECIPQPMTMTGHPAWGDPENHPWTTGWQLNYATEAQLWGQWVEENTEPGVTVAGLVMNNDFGAAYESAFQAFADESDHEINFVVQRHDPAAPTVTNEVTSLAAEDPDVFIAMTAGAPCTRAIDEVARSGLAESATALFQPSVCSAIESFIAPAGDAAEGWLIFGGGAKDLSDPQWAEDPWVSFARGLLEEAGEDPNVGGFSSGFLFAWAEGEAMKIAEQMEGGFTRPNFILALRALNTPHPQLLPGVAHEMNGNADAYFVEGSQVSRFDAAEMTWVQEGDPIDRNGETPNCAFNTDTSSCE